MTDFIACYDSLVDYLNPKLGLKFWTEAQDCPMLVWGRKCGLSMACLWPSFGLVLDSLGARSGIVLCPGCGMFVLPVMAVCVGYFVGISYVTIGL